MSACGIVTIEVYLLIRKVLIDCYKWYRIYLEYGCVKADDFESERVYWYDLNVECIKCVNIILDKEYYRLFPIGMLHVHVIWVW